MSHDPITRVRMLTRSAGKYLAWPFVTLELILLLAYTGVQSQIKPVLMLTKDRHPHTRTNPGSMCISSKTTRIGSIIIVILLTILFLTILESGHFSSERETDSGKQSDIESREIAIDNVDDDLDTETSEYLQAENEKFDSGTDENSVSNEDSSTDINTWVDQNPDLFQESESPDPFVAFYSDNQSDSDEEDQNHQRVVNFILATDADPIFHAGDVMEDGTQDSLDRFNAVTETLRSTRTFYAALGNNDREVGDPTTPSQLFLDNFTFPNNEQWYSINYGNLHLVVLDSAFSSTDQDQMSWLSDDLMSIESQSRIIGVMFHHPTFSSSISHQLVDLGVDFVISGHNHAYSHTVSDGIHFFVLSGQPAIGYLTAEIYSDSVSITAYDHNNSVIENIVFDERECTSENCDENLYRMLFQNPARSQSHQGVYSPFLLTQL